MIGLSRIVALALCVAALVACGGGGGGGGGNPNPPAPTPTPTPTPSGEFTLSDTSVSLTALKGSGGPSKDITLTITAPAGVGAVGAAFPVSEGVPSWLNVVILGTMPNFTVRLTPTTSATTGHFTATLLVGTADQSGNVLKSASIPVTYDVVAGVFYLGPSTAALDFVFGHSDATKTLTLNVDAAGATWTVASTVPWIAAPAGDQQGSQNLAVAVDAATLGVGNHAAKVTVANVGFPSQRFTVDVTARVRAPAFSVNTGSVLIGGPDGLDSTSQPFAATLETGTNVYPWTLQLSDAQGLGWLTSSAASGSVSGNQNASVSLGFDRSKVSPGTYTGTARFDAVVKGVTFSASTPVTLKLESQRLFPEYEGVALSSFPGRNTLTRSIKVTASTGRAGVPWTAASDQSWLSVTASGVTGGSLQLTANPAGLVHDKQYVAVVTLSSSDPGIERSEHVRVGMWVGSADPVDVLAAPIELQPDMLAANPVEALAYSVRYSDTIYVYNVYSGALVDTFALGSHSLGIGVSGDGRLLFASDSADGRTRVLDAVTGALVRTYPGAFVVDAPDPGFIYARPSGHPIVFTPIGEVFDLETHTRVGGGHSMQRVGSPDGKWVVLATPTQVILYAQRFSKLTAPSWELGLGVETPPIYFELTGRDLAIAASGERVFITTSSGLKVFQVTPTALTPLPDVNAGFPAALEAAWNGRVYVGLGLTGGEPDDNLLIFDDVGNSLGSAKSGPNNGRFAGQLTFSGDLTRVISTHVVPAAIPSNSPTHYTVSFYNLPP